MGMVDTGDKSARRSFLHLLSGVTLPVVSLAFMITLFFVAHSVLGEWAEENELHHSIQHVLIFVAGAGSSIATIRLFRPKKNDK